MSTEKIFTDGLIVKRRDNAPEYVMCNLSIKVSEFKAFLDQHQSGGWVNIDCLVGKSGKPYGALDTWKPTQGDHAKAGMEKAREAAQAPAGGMEDFEDSIPFAQHEKGLLA